MYGSDAGQPPRSLYTKGLKPLCDIFVLRTVRKEAPTVYCSETEAMYVSCRNSGLLSLTSVTAILTVVVVTRPAGRYTRTCTLNVHYLCIRISTHAFCHQNVVLKRCTCTPRVIYGVNSSHISKRGCYE